MLTFWHVTQLLMMDKYLLWSLMMNKLLTKRLCAPSAGVWPNLIIAINSAHTGSPDSIRVTAESNLSRTRIHHLQQPTILAVNKPSETLADLSGWQREREEKRHEGAFQSMEECPAFGLQLNIFPQLCIFTLLSKSATGERACFPSPPHQ